MKNWAMTKKMVIRNFEGKTSIFSDRGKNPSKKLVYFSGAQSRYLVPGRQHPYLRHCTHNNLMSGVSDLLEFHSLASPPENDALL